MAAEWADMTIGKTTERWTGRMAATRIGIKARWLANHVAMIMHKTG